MLNIMILRKQFFEFSHTKLTELDKEIVNV